MFNNKRTLPQVVFTGLGWCLPELTHFNSVQLKGAPPRVCKLVALPSLYQA